MALPIISNAWRAAIRGTCPSGQRWVNVLHFLWAGAGSPIAADKTALVTNLTTMYTVGPGATTGILEACVAACTLDDITLLALDGTSASETYATPAVGAAAGDSLPSETSLGVKLASGFRGRSKRGRIFLPPFSEGNSGVDGRLNSAAVAALVLNFTTMNVTNFPSISWNWRVASYKLASTVAVTAITVDRNFHVQRGRRG